MNPRSEVVSRECRRSPLSRCVLAGTLHKKQTVDNKIIHFKLKYDSVINLTQASSSPAFFYIVYLQNVKHMIVKNEYSTARASG